MSRHFEAAQWCLANDWSLECSVSLDTLRESSCDTGGCTGRMSRTSVSQLGVLFFQILDIRGLPITMSSVLHRQLFAYISKYM